MKRAKTEYPGVVYREAARIGGRGKERVYYVRWKKDGAVYEEKVGRQYADDMTPARAARIRGQLIEGKRQTRPQKREAEKECKWTIQALWEDYKEKNPGLKGLPQDESRYQKYIGPALGNKEPAELVPLDIDRIKIKLLKTMKPASVKNVLELLRRLLGYAAKKRLCPVPSWKVTLPAVNNLKTEDLTPKQLEKLLAILREGIVKDKDGNQTLISLDARSAMLLALTTGMRRGEIFKLEWADVDFQRGFITIREPKGGANETIPMSEAARKILESHPRGESEFVFPGRHAGHRVDASKEFRRIRDAAGLPKDFRPMHGLRHTFASHLASSGAVDLYTLQRLLTHKSFQMTQRYAHLRDETLRHAANLAGELVKGAEK